MNETLQTIKKRVSLRNYQDKKITTEHMDAIIQGAMLAPTAGNMMLYSIIKVTDQEMKEKLAASCDNQPFIAKADTLLIFALDWQKWQDYYRLSGVPEKCLAVGTSFHTPAEGEFLLAATDAIIAAQNAVIAAESLNIGSCYIGDVIEQYEYHKELLNLPDLVFPVVMLTLGYYPERMRRVHRDRFDPKYVVFENTYQRLSDNELKAMFSQKTFRSDTAENFGQYMYERKSGTDFIIEMTRSVKAAFEKWNEEEGIKTNK